MIPGTATDWRMYSPQLENFPTMIVPSWLPPLERETISSYARRLAESINTTHPFFLGGTSLGGMIAQEMAKTVKPSGLILIATSSSSQALPQIWRVLGKVIYRCPDVVVKLLLKIFSLCAHLLNTNRFPHKKIYARMLSQMSPSIVRWQSGVATEWSLDSSLDVPVFRIHGAKDKIFPLENISHPQQVVRDAGHWVNVTHAGEVNAFISACLRTQEAVTAF